MSGGADLCAELRSLQALLAGHQVSGSAAGNSGPAIPPPPPPLAGAHYESSSSSDEDAPATRVRGSAKKIKAVPPSAQQQVQLQEMERQLAALRQKSAEDADRCRRLEEALEAAQRDAALVGGRLRSELVSKQEESAQLAELVLSLREEADGLRQQVHCATSAAQHSGQSAQASLAQLQAAASEWRRQGEDSLEALAEEREHSTALQTEVTRLRAQAEALQRQVGEERERARAAAAEAAGMSTAELRGRLGQERAWRKAVCRWLEGEMATRADLERLLVNVGAAASTGDHGSCTSWGALAAGAPPPLPPRRMAASQLAPQPPGSPTAVRVTVHSPPGEHTLMVGVDAGSGACGDGSGAFEERRSGGRSSSGSGQRRHSGGSSRDACAGAKTSSGGTSGSGNCVARKADSRMDWKDHFKATMTAFDERHSRLQAELSTLRREALMQAS